MKPLAIAILFGIGLATAAQAGAYPPAVHAKFVDSCVEGGGKRRFCECTVRRIESRYSLAELVTLYERSSNRGEKVPSEYLAAGLECLDD
jgi:hypothetical protein